MDTSTEQRELADRVRLLLKQVIPAQAGSAGIALITGIALWHGVPRHLVIGWVAAIWLLVAVRILVSRRFLGQQRSDQDVLRWRPIAIAGAFASGALYGIGAFLFLPYSDPFQLVFITVLVAGSIASGLASQTPYPPAFTAFSIAVLVPYATGMLMRPEPALAWVGALTFIYLLTQLAHGRYLSRMVSESIRLRYENAELVEELREQKRLAEQAALSKSHFLAAASHDLRQPVHALGLFLEAQQGESLPANAARLQHLMARSVQALATLTDSLLDVSRIEAGTLQSRSRPIQLAPLFGQLAAEMEPLATAKGIRLRVRAGDYWAHSDHHFLERILRNLLDNAIKYTDQGAVLMVCRRRPGTTLSIEVLDSGPGIPEEEKKRIFEEYYQSGKSHDTLSGIGLGLAIVKGLADNLGHRLDLDSRPGSGSVFRIHLPRARPSIPAPIRPLFQEPEVAGLRLIVIDDDPDILESLKALLRQWRCEVAAYPSLQACLADHGRRGRPDLLLVDYYLGATQTGDQAVEAIRAHYRYPIDAFLITGETAAPALRRLEETGLPILRKPLQPARLRLALNSVKHQGSAKPETQPS